MFRRRHCSGGLSRACSSVVLQLSGVWWCMSLVMRCCICRYTCTVVIDEVAGVVKVEASARWQAPANSLAPNGCEEDLALATSTRALSPSHNLDSTAQCRLRVVAVEPKAVGPCGRTLLSTSIIYPAYLTIFKPPSVQRYSGAAKFGRRRVMTNEGRFGLLSSSTSTDSQSYFAIEIVLYAEMISSQVRGLQASNMALYDSF